MRTEHDSTNVIPFEASDESTHAVATVITLPGRSAFRTRVLEYLDGELGRTAPESVVKAMHALSPFDLGRQPARKLHAVRVVIEQVHARQRRAAVLSPRARRYVAALLASGVVG